MKYESITVPLNSIVQHDFYAPFSQFLTLASYMLTSAEALTKDAIESSLLLHPVLVMKPSRSKSYHCIGGLRSLTLARGVLVSDASLQVVLLARQDSAEIKQLVHADILLTHLLFSLRSPRTVGEIFHLFAKDDLARLLSESALSKAGYAAKLDYALNTVFPPGKR
jgi:hypothetical protein